MGPKHFDTLTRLVCGTSARSSRRGVLRLLPALPVAGVLTTFVARLGERTSAHPVERVQKRRDHHRKRARRRQDRRHEQRTRDNGSGNPGGGQTCVPLDQVCAGPLGDPCCGDTTCSETAVPFLTTCQLTCDTTAQCQQSLNMSAVECVDGGSACGSLGHSVKCCRPTTCAIDKDCAGGVCCSTLLGDKRCCAKGQKCAQHGGCATT